MFKTASSTVEEARQEIEIMKKTGEKVRPLSFGEGTTVFVSTDIHLILALDVLEVDGVLYYIGLKKPEESP